MPEEYWQIIKRWLWVIVIFGVLGGAGSYFLVSGLFRSADYSARSVIGVQRSVNVGNPAVDDPEMTGSLLSEFTRSLAAFAEMPQFIGRLRSELPMPLSNLPIELLKANIKVTANENLFLVSVAATGSTSDDAAVLAEVASDVLVKYATESEAEAVRVLSEGLGQRRTTASTRLEEVYAAIEAKVQTAGLPSMQLALANLLAGGAAEADQFRTALINLARSSRDPELLLLQTQVDVLEAELKSVGQEQERLTLLQQANTPPAVVTLPTETANRETEPKVQRRNLAFLGGLGGLLVGWVIANGLERILRSRRLEEEEDEEDRELA